MLLDIKDLKKDFKIGKNVISVLKGVNFSVDNGEIIAVMGRSGSGKSTLLNILGTLDRPNSGSVLFNDDDIFEFNDRKLADFRNKNIGFVFQFHHLLPEFDAIENVMLPGLIVGENKLELKERAISLLNRIGLKERLYHRSSELSGGEQQRVAFARALINNPKLILADEPSGNLDSESSEMLHKIMWEFVKEFNTAFILVTHDDTLAKKADKIIKITDGII